MSRRKQANPKSVAKCKESQNSESENDFDSNGGDSDCSLGRLSGAEKTNGADALTNELERVPGEAEPLSSLFDSAAYGIVRRKSSVLELFKDCLEVRASTDAAAINGDDLIDQSKNLGLAAVHQPMGKERRVSLVEGGSPPAKQSRRQSIRNGGRSASSDDADMECPICVTTFTSQHEFTVHIRSHNSCTDTVVDESSGTTLIVHTCKLCGKSLSSSSSLDRHMLVHSGERPFQCRICGISFTTNGNMHRHMRTHHGQSLTRLRTMNPKRKKSECILADAAPDASLAIEDVAMEGEVDCPGVKPKEEIKDEKPIEEQTAVDMDLEADLPSPLQNNNFKNMSQIWQPCITEPPLEQLQCATCSKSFLCNYGLKAHIAAGLRNQFSCLHCASCKSGASGDEPGEKPANYELLQRLQSNYNLDGFNVKCSSFPAPPLIPITCDAPVVMNPFAYPHFIPSLLQQDRLQPYLPPSFLNHIPIMKEGESPIRDCSDCASAGAAREDLRCACETKKRTFLAMFELHPAKQQPVPFDGDLSSKLNVSLSLINCSNNNSNANIPSLTEIHDFADINSIVKMATNHTNYILNPSTLQNKPDSNVYDFEPGNDNYAETKYKTKENKRRVKSDNALSEPVDGAHFSCNVCSYTTTDRGTLLRHLRRHNGDRPFRCRLCEFAFTTKANCERHVRKRHKREDYTEMVICSQLTKRRKQKEASSCDLNQYKCNMCREVFVGYNSCFEHIIKAHSDLAGEAHCLIVKVDKKKLKPLIKNGEVKSEVVVDYEDQVEPLDLVVRPAPTIIEEVCNNEDSEDFGQPLNLSTKSRKEDQPLCFSNEDEIVPTESLVDSVAQSINNDVANFINTMAAQMQTTGLLNSLGVPNGFLASYLLKAEELRSATCTNDDFGLEKECEMSPASSPPPKTPPPEMQAKFVLKNGVLLRRQKQRRYRTERPYRCAHCTARFTLRSNMDRHIKQQHPQFWCVKTKGRKPLFDSSKAVPADDVKEICAPDEAFNLTNAVKKVLSWQIKQKHLNDGKLDDKERSLLRSDLMKGNGDDDGVLDLASVSKLLHTANETNIQEIFKDKEQSGSDDEEQMETYPSYSPDCNNTPDEGALEIADDAQTADDSRTAEPDPEQTQRKKKEKRSAYTNAPNRVSCTYCFRKFPWTSSLRRHMLTHTGQKPYKCPQCPLLFTTKSNCGRHLMRKHGQNVDLAAGRNVPERPHKCHLCPSSTFSSLSNLRKHQYSKHIVTVDGDEHMNGELTIDLGFVENESVDADMDDNQPEDQEGTENGASEGGTSDENEGKFHFVCHICENVCFANRQKCIHHLKQNHLDECGKLLKKDILIGLVDETASVTSDDCCDMEYDWRFVLCALCLRRLSSAEEHAKHMKAHSEKPFTCDFCYKRFTLKHSMLRHKKQHEQEDNFNQSRDPIKAER